MGPASLQGGVVDPHRNTPLATRVTAPNFVAVGQALSAWVEGPNFFFFWGGGGWGPAPSDVDVADP